MGSLCWEITAFALTGAGEETSGRNLLLLCPSRVVPEYLHHYSIQILYHGPNCTSNVPGNGNIVSILPQVENNYAWTLSLPMRELADH